jgi:outer membrane protein assembly factor BamB
VAVEDANNNVITSDNTDQVNLAIGTNPAQGTLTGTTAGTVNQGVATFSNLAINKVGTGYALTASSGSLTSATSGTFNITLGAATKLAFVQGPTNAVAGAVISPAVTVAVEDANNNVITSDNTDVVNLAIGTNPAQGTLTGTTTVTVNQGVATFSNLSINNAGTGYTLTATASSYAPVTSAAFNITATSSDWTAYLQGNDRTGFASTASGFNPTSVPNLQLTWQTADKGPNHGVFSQPVTSNGLVYWGSFDGYERATNTSGTLVWQTNLGTTSPPGCTDPSEAGVVSTPTITTDVPVGGATSVLYIGGGDSKMYALNAATGTVLWSYDVGGNPDTFIWDSPVVFGNSVYIGVASFGDCPLVQGQIVQLNRVTGALQNIFDIVPNGCTGGGVWGSLTVDAAAGTIYFTTGTPGDCPSTLGGPALMELRASNLSLVGTWTVPLGQQLSDPDFGSTPTLFTGVIGGQSVPLVGAINKNGVFYAFKRDALSAGPVWSTRIATGGGAPIIGQGDQASAAFDGTTLYVGGDNMTGCSGSVNALNPSTGAFIWRHCFTDGGFVLGGVTVSSGGVVAVGEGNNIAVVSAATGASLFTYTGVGPFYGPPSIANGTLYEGDMSGNLYALTPSQTAAGQFVQVNSATPQTNQSTVTLPYTKAQAAGDLNAIAIGFTDTTSTITSVTDSSGNVYQPATPLTRGTGMSQAIYYAKNIKAATAGSNVVTVKFSAAVAYADVRVAEYSGLNLTNPLDTTASAAGSGAASSSGNLTTSAANEVIFGAGYTTSLFQGGTNGFTSRIITPMDGDIAGDKFVAAAGTYAATAQNADSSAKWIMQAVAFHV